jgi:hypothetical protein
MADLRKRETTVVDQNFFAADLVHLRDILQLPDRQRWIWYRRAISTVEGWSCAGSD